MGSQIKLDGVTIDGDSDCYVIAEIGSNHMGELETCKAIMRAAKESGANAVKLQKRDNRRLYTEDHVRQSLRQSQQLTARLMGNTEIFLSLDARSILS